MQIALQVEPTTVTIPIEQALANRYNQASEQEPRKIEAIVYLHLSDAINQVLSDTQPDLSAIVHRLSRQAIANGMTPEILEEMLQEE